MAGISGMQYIIGIKFGIDSIFVDPYITTKTSHPGRMSPNACLSLTLLPISILSWQFIENGQKKLATCLPSAAIPLLLSVFALLGYAFDIESGYSWWSLSSMSPPAATGIFFLSLSILSLIPKLGDHHKNLSDKFIWRPAFIATLGIALTFLLSQNILMTVRKNAEEMASADLSHKIQIIKLEISEDIDAMLRMKDRLNSAKSMNLSDWERDAKNYIADNAAYKGFILIDDQFNQIQNIRPADSDLEWNKRHLSGISNFGNIKNREFILKKTEYSKDTEGVEFIFPISHKDVSGFLIVPYDVSYKINLTPDTIRKEKSYLTISDSVEGIVFSSRENIDFPWKIEKNEIIEISSLIWAAHQVVDASNYRSSTLAVIVLLSGIGLSIMLSYLVLQNHKISFFAQNIKLSKERYDFALGSAIVGVWNWEIEGDKTIWSGASWKILGALDNDYLTKNYQTIKHEIFSITF